MKFLLNHYCIVAACLLPLVSLNAQTYTELLVSTNTAFVNGQNNAGLDSASARSGFLWDRRASDTSSTISFSAAANASYIVNNVDRIMSTVPGGSDNYFPYYGSGFPRVVVAPTANGSGVNAFSATLDLGANFLMPESGYTVTRSYIEIFDFGLNQSTPALTAATIDFQVYVNDGSTLSMVTDAASLLYELVYTDGNSNGVVSYLGEGTFRFTATGLMTTGAGVRIFGLQNEGDIISNVQRVDFLIIRQKRAMPSLFGLRGRYLSHLFLNPPACLVSVCLA